MTKHSMNGHGGQDLVTLEAREVRRLFEQAVSSLGSPWSYDPQAPTLRGCFGLGDGAVCGERCLIELVGRTAPESGIHPFLEVCSGRSILTIEPELETQDQLSITALRFALQWHELNQPLNPPLGGSSHAE